MKQVVQYSSIVLIAILGSAFTHTTGVLELLTQSPWTNLQVWEDNAGTGVYTQTPYDCIEDNNWVFLQSGALMILEDSLRCVPDLPQADSMNYFWELRLNDDFLSLTSEYDEEEMIYEIISIGQDSMVLLKVEDQYQQYIIHEKLVFTR
ncbi:MAG: hypothetical protein IT262_14945 [Saprospiraceae bacterium]|nr:hypothetical protein [Saprospiraceae bacterium]